MCRSVVNPLSAGPNKYNVIPYGTAAGNVNNPNGEISFNFGTLNKFSKDALKGALAQGANLFWAGHGGPAAILASPGANKNASLTAGEIAKLLGNPSVVDGATTIANPYKCVILFCCEAYSKEMADAFGIADYTVPRVVKTTPISGTPIVIGGVSINAQTTYLEQGRSTDSTSDYNNLGKIPQVFVAWPGVFQSFGPKFNTVKLQNEQFNIANILSMWQQGYPIDACINDFGTAEAVLFPFDSEGNTIPDDQKWELSGCHDLTTKDRQ
jgi:hypothetical protein